MNLSKPTGLSIDKPDSRHLGWGFWQVLLGLASLASGIALVTTIVFGLSLGLMVTLLCLCATLLFCLRYGQLNRPQRLLFRARLKTGLIAGLAATAAYDATRAITATLAQTHYFPFEAFPIFGQLLTGATGSLAVVVGVAYHLFNGLSFAVGYCYLLGDRPWWFGVGWALGLELAMLIIYPEWLDLSSVYNEFVAISILGHVSYGATLGLISHKKLVKNMGPELR